MITAIGLAIGALSMESLHGGQVTMDNYRERAGTVLVFLSSRCPATLETIETINTQYEETREQGILFVGLCANDSETSAELIDFVHKRALRFPVYRDPGGAIAKKLGVSLTPEALLLDDRGVLRYRGGFLPKEAGDHFAKAARLLLSKQPQATPSFEAKGTPIAESGKPILLDDPYGSPHYESGLIFEKIPGAPVHHCSTIAETASGDLVAVWYGGSYESADDQVLFISRRGPGGGPWTRPEILLRGAFLHPPGNAVVFRVGASRRLGLLWGRMDGSRPVRRGEGWDQCQLMWRFSEDDGKTWSPDRALDGLAGVLPRNIPILLQDGTLAVPMSGEREGKHGGFLLCTRDDGNTWASSGMTEGGSQPTVIQRKDGSLLALLRSEPYILQSESSDLGKTWSPPKATALRCPGSGIAMCRLANGHLLLAYNDSPNSDRTPLNVIRSTDEGATWGDRRTFEADWGEYSYPCLIQDSVGAAHLTYTFRRYAIKHTEFNEDWIEHLLRPN